MKRRFHHWRLALAIVVGCGWQAHGQSLPLPLAPDSPGFSPERLTRMHDTMSRFVEENRHAGIVTLIARQGRIIDWRTFGYQDIEAGIPMRKDTICRIYSMTKTVTTVGVLMLLEEGRISLEDPIGDYIPDLNGLQVLAGGTLDDPVLEPANGPMTIKHLLTHTSGMTYGFIGEEPIHEFYRQAELWDADTLREFVQRVAKLPLMHHPGEDWSYGISLDVSGYLIEVVSGERFEDFLRRRIFEPLEMRDTAFFVPRNKRERLATLYQHGSDGGLEEAPPILGAYAEEGRGFPSGGGGLFSTPGDYLRFAQMLLDGGRLRESSSGELSEERLLGRKTVEFMMVNHLGHLPDPTITWSDSEGFGLGGSVRTNMGGASHLGSLGQFGWYGAATTYYNIDPKEGTVAILFTQHVPFNEHGVFGKFSNTFYQALE